MMSGRNSAYTLCPKGQVALSGTGLPSRGCPPSRPCTSRRCSDGVAYTTRGVTKHLEGVEVGMRFVSFGFATRLSAAYSTCARIWTLRTDLAPRWMHSLIVSFIHSLNTGTIYRTTHVVALVASLSGNQPSTLIHHLRVEYICSPHTCSSFLPPRHDGCPPCLPASVVERGLLCDRGSGVGELHTACPGR